MSITEEDNYQDMMEYVDYRLTPNINAKNNRGEVFTPLNLINGMLDHLPPEVWENPNLKWLDPANGIGNFPICVYYRLMDGLRKVFPDETTRSHHIIENMLYMVELDDANVAISRSFFCERRDGEVIDGNISQQDFLKYKKPKGWPDNFDIIMGNPPYNSSQKATGKRGGGNDLWSNFVKDCIELLNDNCTLVFVTPAGWRKPESNDSKFKGLFKLMAHDNYMKYLEIHNTNDGMKVFKAGTRFDIYVIEKKLPTREDKTIVLDELGNLNELDLLQWTFLPNFDYDMVVNLLAHNEQERCKHKIDVLFERSKYGSDKDKDWTIEDVVKDKNKSRYKYKIDVLYESSKYETRKDWTIEDVVKDKNKSKYSDFKYPLVHSTPKGGHRFYYSNTIQKYNDDKRELKNTPVELVGENVFFGIPKVIFGESGINEVIIDMNGDYGMTQGAMALRVNNQQQAEQIKQALESDIFNTILEACSFGNFRIDWRIFTHFKKDWYNTVLENMFPVVS